MIRRISKLFSAVRLRLVKTYASIKRDIQKSPLTNFYLSLLVLLLLIGLSSVFQTPPKAAESQVLEPKQAAVFHIGSVPKMRVQAQIEKTGITTVVALSNGVVQKIHYSEGDSVSRGNTLVSLSTNYQGGNASSIQRQLADTQYKSALDTFDLQKDLLQKQRDIATKSDENADKLRDITNESRTTTRDLIDFNKSLLENINTSLDQVQNTPGADPEMLAALQGQKAQLLAGLAQAQGSLSAADYQADSDRPPAQLAQLQKDLALKQLDLQEKMQGVNKEVSRLQLQLAQVSEALMFPSSPLTGVVQRVFVKEGDVIAAGASIAVVGSGADETQITAIAYVPKEVASKISQIEPSVIHIGEQKHEEYPYFVSSEAVQGNSYAIYFAVPKDSNQNLTDKGYIEIEIPIGYADTTASASFVPVDAVYQTEDSAHLFVIENGRAKSRAISLGEVFGTYVAVTKGLGDGDEVIVSRNVVEGDRVQVQK